MPYFTKDSDIPEREEKGVKTYAERTEEMPP